MTTATFTPLSSDDYGAIEYSTPTPYFSPGQDTLPLGKGDSPLSTYTRFYPTIPNAATITTAYLRIYSPYEFIADEVDVQIYFNAIDDAVCPTDADEYAALALTDAIAWNNISGWYEGLTYDSPELKTVLQAIINRSSFVPGNAVMVLIKDNGSTNYRIGDATTVGLYVEWEGGATFHINTYQAVSTWIGEFTESQALPVYLSGFMNSQIANPSSLGNSANQSLIGALSDELYFQIKHSLGDEKFSVLLSTLGFENTSDLLIGMGLEINDKVLLQIGTFEQSAQSLKLLLSRGDNTNQNQSVLTLLPEEIKIIQSLNNELSEAVVSTQKILSSLVRGDNVGKTQALLNTIPEEQKIQQSIISDLADSITTAQKILSSLVRGDNVGKTQALLNTIPEEQKVLLTLCNALSNGVTNAQNIGVSLSGEQIKAMQNLLQSIADYNDIRVQQSLIIDSSLQRVTFL